MMADVHVAITVKDQPKDWVQAAISSCDPIETHVLYDKSHEVSGRRSWMGKAFLLNGLIFNLIQADQTPSILIVLDADDLILPGGIGALTMAMGQTHYAPFACGRWVEMDEEGLIDMRNPKSPPPQTESVLLSASPSPGLIAYRLRYLRAIGGFNARVYGMDDVDACLALAKLFGNGVVSHAVTHAHRRHRLQASNRARLDSDFYDYRNKALDWIRKQPARWLDGSDYNET